MCFDRNINGNRDVKNLECDYLSVQRCVKLTLVAENKYQFNFKTPISVFNICFENNHAEQEFLNKEENHIK